MESARDAAQRLRATLYQARATQTRAATRRGATPQLVGLAIPEGAHYQQTRVEPNSIDALLMDVDPLGASTFTLKHTGRGSVPAATAPQLLFGHGPLVVGKQKRSPKAQLGDESTKMLTGHLQASDFTRMIREFYRLLEGKLQAYAEVKGIRYPYDLCLYFKGGNMFNICLKNITNMLTAQYSDLFERSDADFSVWISPNMDDRVFRDVEGLVVKALYEFRAWIDGRKALLKLPGLVPNAEKYQKVLDKVKGLDEWKVDGMLPGVPRRDFIIRDVQSGSGETWTGYSDTDLLQGEKDPLMGQTPFYISANMAIAFPIDENNLSRTIRFNLIRMKYNIDLELVKKKQEAEARLSSRRTETKPKPVVVHAPSELIDVSIAQKSDAFLRTHSEHMFPSRSSRRSRVEPYLKQYETQVDGERFVFWAPTLTYLAHDLENIFFERGSFPWEDGKFTKRMKRYVLTRIIFEMAEVVKTHRGASADMGTALFNEIRRRIVDLSNEFTVELAAMSSGISSFGIVQTERPKTLFAILWQDFVMEKLDRKVLEIDDTQAEEFLHAAQESSSTIVEIFKHVTEAIDTLQDNHRINELFDELRRLLMESTPIETIGGRRRGRGRGRKHK